MVRGLDYYTKTAFEVTTDALGAQNAIAGGGRYDRLVQDLGGPESPGIGFAVGLERLIAVAPIPDEDVIRRPDLFIAALGEGGAGLSPLSSATACGWRGPGRDGLRGPEPQEPDEALGQAADAATRSSWANGSCRRRKPCCGT